MTSTWASHHLSSVSVCQLLLWEMSPVWVPTSYNVVNEFRQNPLDRWRSCTEINNSIPLLKFSIWRWCRSDPLLTVDYVSRDDDDCYDWLICCRYLFVLRFPIESLIFVLNVSSSAYVAVVWCTGVELISDKLSENFRFYELGRIYYNITWIML